MEIEEFGHPVEKLARLGARILGTRRIETLYRVRYISSEQGVPFLMGWNHRPSDDLLAGQIYAHDIAAYPVFVSAIR